MKTSKIFLMSAMVLSAFGLQSCLDYDTPSDEFQKETTVVTPPTISTGKADCINYNVEITEKMYQNAYKRLRSQLGTALTGIYSIRGGKEGGKPEAHAYQFQFCLGPDNYVQYSCVPHSDFPYSNAELKSTYHLSKGFNGGPGGGFSSCKTCIAPILNNGDLDSIPELKAAYLLLYNYAAIENADMFGPMPYNDFKKNRDESPFKYDDVRTIYYSAKANIDSCVAAFKHFQKRPEWYKTKVVKNIFINRLPLLKNADLYEAEGLQPWIEFANSLKLRMAIHLAKVEPQTAKEWAEAAVRDGVISQTSHEFALYASVLGFDHPIVQISEWGDSRLGASFCSMLESLDHPYVKYLFKKNTEAIEKTGNKGSAPKTTPAESVIVGMRDGTVPGIGQSAGTNSYISFSKLDNQYMNSHFPPCYFMKLSEVCFLRAEGALRGWNMGGSAQQFYEEGIRYAFLEDRDMEDIKYKDMLEDYMNVTKAKDYTYVDPTGETPDMPSVTKIPVKWDNSLDNEKKLEMIITQKYIASYPYSYESWVDLRRTGYPRLFPVLNPEDGDGSLTMGDNAEYCSGLNIIRRLPWFTDDPQTKEDLNATGLPALGGPDQQATRLWWDVDAPNF